MVVEFYSKQFHCTLYLVWPSHNGDCSPMYNWCITNNVGEYTEDFGTFWTFPENAPRQINNDLSFFWFRDLKMAEWFALRWA